MFTDVMLDHNRVDMRVWLKKEKRLFTVEMCTPYDENMAAQLAEKQERYKGLVAELAAEYRGRAEVIQVSLILGALLSGHTGRGTHEDYRGQREREVRVVAERMQRATISGTLKLFNKFKMMR